MKLDPIFGFSTTPHVLQTCGGKSSIFSCHGLSQESDLNYILNPSS